MTTKILSIISALMLGFLVKILAPQHTPPLSSQVDEAKCDLQASIEKLKAKLNDTITVR